MEIKNRRATTMLLDKVLFILLNLAFIVLILFYLKGASNSDFLRERVYAEKIAVIFDLSECKESISLNIGSILKRAEENKIPREEIFRIDEENSEVIVKLTKDGGHRYSFFSGCDFSLTISNDNLLIKTRA